MTDTDPRIIAFLTTSDVAAAVENPNLHVVDHSAARNPGRAGSGRIGGKHRQGRDTGAEEGESR